MFHRKHEISISANKKEKEMEIIFDTAAANDFPLSDHT
jgi:hypothetical protein